MPFWSFSISPTPKKLKICWIFTTNYFYKGLFRKSEGVAWSQLVWWIRWEGHLRCGAFESSEIRWLHQLSLVVYPSIYWAFYIPRGFLSSTGYLCFLCGISSKSRMTGYHDTTNGKPMVAWKVSPPFFFGKRHHRQCQELQVKLWNPWPC